MRQISIAVVILLFASATIAQQGPTTPKTQTSGSPVLPPSPIIGGDGNPNYIPIWATHNYLLSSVLYQDSTGKVGVGTTTPQVKLDVNGNVNVSDHYRIANNNVVSIGSIMDGDLFVGVYAGLNNVPGSGAENAFLGAYAGELNTDGVANTYIGFGAGYFPTTAKWNTYVGDNVGPTGGNGSGNIMLGISAGYQNTGGNNNIYIGNVGPSGSEDSTIRIGGDDQLGYGPQTATFIAGIHGSTSSGGIPVYINSNGRLGTTTSSLRFKERVRDMGDSTSALMRLRPVTFFYKGEYADGERTLQYGLIAEEVAKVYPELVAYDKDGQPYSVRYQYLSTMLLNEVQKQYRSAEAQAQTIKTQEQKIEQLEERLSRLEKVLVSQAQLLAQK